MLENNIALKVICIFPCRKTCCASWSYQARQGPCLSCQMILLGPVSPLSILFLTCHPHPWPCSRETMGWHAGMSLSNVGQGSQGWPWEHLSKSVGIQKGVRQSSNYHWKKCVNYFHQVKMACQCILWTLLSFNSYVSQLGIWNLLGALCWVCEACLAWKDLTNSPSQFANENEKTNVV